MQKLFSEENMHNFASNFTKKWRKAMLSFALLNLPTREEAEDAVQDALLAILQVDEQKIKQVDSKNYIFGILRNKIADRLRKKYRMGDILVVQQENLDEELFNEKGHWVDKIAIARWDSPDRILQSMQFFTVLDSCIHKLPEKAARVFSMKEFLEFEAEEICSTLQISKTDYWKNMSRARKQLQVCLNLNWSVELRNKYEMS